MSELVSVIIPARNRGGFIAATLESVARQTHADWEAIVIDDGSTDDTARVVADLARQDGRIRLVQHRQSLGAQAARNSGVRAARYEWLAFLDSDDRWLPRSLELRLQQARALGVDVVHSDCLILAESSDEPQRMMLPRIRGDAYESLLAQPGPMFQTLLVTRSAIEEIGLLDVAIVAYQEWDTAIRLAERRAFGFVDDPTFVYDCRHTETISKDLVLGARGYEQVVMKHAGAIVARLGWQALLRHVVQSARLYHRAEDRRSMLTVMLRGLARMREIAKNNR